MISVFLSHSASDKEHARKIAADLRLYGVRVWLDEAELKIGDSLIHKLSQAVYEADFVAAIITRHSITSTWVQAELQWAMNREIEGRRVKVLPLLFDADCVLPAYFAGKLYGDFTKPLAYQTSLQILLRTLNSTELDWSLGLPLMQPGPVGAAAEKVAVMQLLLKYGGTVRSVRDLLEVRLREAVTDLRSTDGNQGTGETVADSEATERTDADTDA